LLGSAAALALTATSATAQDAPAVAQDAAAPEANAETSGLEEIVVTAQKREENLQRTPIAITAFSAGELERTGSSNILDLNTRVPNVFIGGGGGAGRAAASFYIRGIGVDAETLAKEPGVGLYIDDIYYGKAAGALISVFDMESIEVLRGPQGTLFGKNTIGGAIRYTTKKPKLGETTADVEANFGTMDRKDLKGAVNLPLGDNLALRVSAATLNQDGYVRNLATGGKQGDDHVDALRGQLRFQKDRWDVNLAVDGIWSHNRGEPRSLESLSQIGQLANWNNVVRGTAPVPVGQDPSIYKGIIDNRYVTGPYKTYGTFFGNTLDTWGATLSAAYDVNDSLTVKSLTAYRRVKMSFKSDVDVTPFDESQVGVTGDYPWFSQELQLIGDTFDKRLQYILGAYYFHETPERVEDRQYHFEPDGNMQFDRVKTTSKALFGQASFDFTDWFKLTLGGRYSVDDKDARTTRTRVVLNTPAARNAYNAALGTNLPLNAIVPLTGRGKTSFKDFAPRIAAQIQATRDLMIYGSAAKGYRAGGFNNGVNPTSPNFGVLPFENEEVWTYETGFRSELLNRRLRLNVSAFYSDYKNLQISASQGGVYILIANVAKARIRGIEAEASAVLFDGLTIGGTLGILDSKYTDIGSETQIVTAITTNSPLAGSPDYTYSADITYRAELPNDASLTFTANWGYKGEIATSTSAATAYLIKPYGLLNGSITYAINDRYSIGVVGKNILDKTYFITGTRLDSPAAGNGGQVIRSVGRPAEAYLTLRARF
jgi:iron complex outermembrane receptor protein